MFGIINNMNRCSFKDIIFNLKCKNDKTHVTYFVELCSYIIPNVSNRVQTQKKICNLDRGQGPCHFVCHRLSMASYPHPACVKRCGCLPEAVINLLFYFFFSFKPHFYYTLFSIHFFFLNFWTIFCDRIKDFSHRTCQTASEKRSTVKLLYSMFWPV